jgi:hypothetical protein
MLRKIIGHKKDETSGQCRGLCNEKLSDVYRVRETMKA